jgi:mannose-1-phosphate guanylyltransferase/phosphomannomutase
MAHMLDLLKSHGITDVIVTLRYMASAIQDYFEDGSNLGMDLEYVVEETPLGTAGSVKNAAQFFDDTFLVVSGDALTDFDLQKIVRAHKESGAMATLTLAHVANPLEYGVIVTDDEGRIAQFLEKPSWGEVISDTVNTGIYVLEPEVLDLIPDNTLYDFSMQLFPRMLEQGMHLNGYVADGYWCDVGNIDEYWRANSDMLYGNIQLPNPIGKHLGGGIWVGEGVEIAPSAQLFGPVYLGNHVKIKGDVMIYGPSVIRDYTVVDNYTRLERDIVWRNSYIGESCELRGTIISRQCSVKSKVISFEGVVVGDNCVLGEGCALHANVKLWPQKQIETGATVKDSIIWGNQGRRTLFNRFGVSGVVNVDLTPEFAAKLGAALGATLPEDCYVAVNRDIHRSSRMIKRALISGLPGAGVNVWDTTAVAIPVVRHFVRSHPNTVAGIHVRLSPFDQRVVDIRFMDENGVNLTKSTERAIERIFFREDFRRAYLDEIGVIRYALNPLQDYMDDFLQHVNADLLREAQFRIVVDYSQGLAADALADILNQLGIDVVPLNARMDETKLAVLQDKFHSNLLQVSKIVRVLGADLGIQLDVGGEKMFIVDEKGELLDDLQSAALMAELALHANPGATMATPIMLSRAFETIAGWHDARVRRVPNTQHGLMMANKEEEILLAVDGQGNFIFPAFHPFIDGMMATVRLLEYLALRKMAVSEIVEYLPPVHMVRSQFDCPWEIKGKIMRLLQEHHGGRRVEKLDGLKIHISDDEWVHLASNPEKPQFEVYAESDSDEHAIALLEEYRVKVRDLVESMGW